jgi:hypothetical protein
MKKLFVYVLLAFVLAGCHRSGVVLKDTDYLKYGTRASVIQKVWGPPDETMAYQDYRATGYYHFSSVGGSWNRYGGSVSGYGYGTTYTPTTIVWIYKEKGKALFFQQRGVLDEQYRYSLLTIMSWKLVGWDNLQFSDDKFNAQKEYAERRINEAGITADADVKLFWALFEKAPKEMAFEQQVEWAIKKTKEIMTKSDKK